MLRINKKRVWLDKEDMSFKAEYLMDDGCLCVFPNEAIEDLRIYNGIDPFRELENHDFHKSEAICIPTYKIGF